MTENGNGMMTYNMPMVPAYGPGYGNGNDGGMFGGNWMWFLLVWMAMFGWGGNGMFSGNGGCAGNAVQRGFDQNAIMNGLQSIQNTINANQLAEADRGYAMQSSFQNCCCENRLGLADLKYAVVNDGAQTRQAMAAGIQGIHDKLCQLEMDGIKQNYENRIAGMQNVIDQLRDMNGNARSLAAFNALGDRFQASQDAQTAALEQYLAPVPRPAYVVQNPNCCGFGYGGCGGYAA